MRTVIVWFICVPNILYRLPRKLDNLIWALRWYKTKIDIQGHEFVRGKLLVHQTEKFHLQIGLCKYCCHDRRTPSKPEWARQCKINSLGNLHMF